MPLSSLLFAALAHRLSTLLCTVLVILLFGSVGHAQSGRAPKPKGSPPATPAESEATAKPAEAKPRKPSLSLIVVKNVPSANVALWTRTVLKELTERLEESPDVTITQEREMNRKEVSDLAKTKRDAYVVWIQLEVDVADSERASITTINPGCLFIKYVVFMAGTANVKAQGRVYQDGSPSVCTGMPSRPSPLPPGPQPRRFPVEYTLKKAARETADRILTALDVRLPTGSLESS